MGMLGFLRGEKILRLDLKDNDMRLVINRLKKGDKDDVQSGKVVKSFKLKSTC